MDQRRTVFCLAAAALAACSSPPQAPAPAPDIDALTASEAAARICAGQLGSQGLIRAYLARVQARPELNAFVTVDANGALAAARAIDQRRAAGAACRRWKACRWW